MRTRRKWALAGAGGAAAGLLLAAGAYACVSPVLVNLSTVNAKAGQEVGITAVGLVPANNVVVRLDTLDGPVLTTVNAPIVGGLLDSRFTVPEGTKPGNYVIVVTQQTAAGQISNAPVRSVLNVTGDGGQPVISAPTGSVDSSVRAKGLAETGNAVSGGTLALVALGVGGVGMFLAGMAALFAGRRPSPAAAPAKR